MEHTYGHHVILEITTFPKNPVLTNEKTIANIMVSACEKAGATVLGSNWHHFGEGHGVTGVVMLAESHASIHTWYDEGYAAIDVFMCGDSNPLTIVNLLVKSFHATGYELFDIKRGTNITKRITENVKEVVA